MKFNTTYKPILNFKNTIKEIDYIKKYIIDILTSKYSLINVIPPIVSEENDEQNINIDIKTRDISFENSESNILKLFLTYSNWGKELLKRIKAKINEGIYFDINTIWRDIKEDVVSTSVKQELIFLFKISEENISSTLEDISIDIYNMFYDLANKINQKYKIKNIYSKIPNFISSQQLENEMPDLTFKERENEFLLNKQSFILQNSGAIMFSGKRHSYIPVQLYDLRNFNQILMFDRNNSSTIKVASIGVLASGNQLSDQLILYGNGKMTSLPFYKDNIKNNQKLLEIKINIPRLAMALLSKGHISEVQSGVVSNESQNIKNRYGVDTY